MLAADGSETTSRSSASDLYFDDEFCGAALQEQGRHLRLNATIGLDNKYNADLSSALFVSPYLASKQHPKVTADLASSSSKDLLWSSSTWETETTAANADCNVPAKQKQKASQGLTSSSSKDLSWSSSTPPTNATLTSGTNSCMFSREERKNILNTKHIGTITGLQLSFFFLASENCCEFAFKATCVGHLLLS